MKQLALCVSVAFGLTACGGGGAFSGEKSPITDEQFAELKSTCNISDARLIDSNRTESSMQNGVPTTITYEGNEPGAKTIRLSRKRSKGQVAQLIMCLEEEFERVGAEAAIDLGPSGFSL